MKLLLDTSYLFSLSDTTDSNHASAQEIRKKVEREGSSLWITPFILEEIITLTSFRLGKEKAIETATLLINPDLIQIIPFSIFQQQRAFALFQSILSKNFSFCDAITFAAAEEEGIDVLVAFDHDFKKIKGPWKVWG